MKNPASLFSAGPGRATRMDTILGWAICAAIFGVVFYGALIPEIDRNTPLVSQARGAPREAANPANTLFVACKAATVADALQPWCGTPTVTATSRTSRAAVTSSGA